MVPERTAFTHTYVHSDSESVEVNDSSTNASTRCPSPRRGAGRVGVGGGAWGVAGLSEVGCCAVERSADAQRRRDGVGGREAVELGA